MNEKQYTRESLKSSSTKREGASYPNQSQALTPPAAAQLSSTTSARY